MAWCLEMSSSHAFTVSTRAPFEPSGHDEVLCSSEKSKLTSEPRTEQCLIAWLVYTFIPQCLAGRVLRWFRVAGVGNSRGCRW